MMRDVDLIKRFRDRLVTGGRLLKGQVAIVGGVRISEMLRRAAPAVVSRSRRNSGLGESRHTAQRQQQQSV
jgi:hypothetical protein